MISENQSLKPFNTFGINCYARYFAVFNNLDDLKEYCTSPIFKNNSHLILGGGSNILFTKDFDGLVLLNKLEGVEKVKETEHHVFIKAQAGVVWHQLVMHCVNNNWGGVENLSLIPGSVGAAPMQNIGAYGVELKDSFWELEALEIDTLKIKTFTNSQCEFGYRESIFKNKAKNRYVILSVTLKLDKNPTLNTSYGAIEQELEKMNVKVPDIKSVSHAVMNIRRSKLPDPEQIGNAGSFFKNPVISNEHFMELQKEFSNLPGYPAEAGTKVAAGWLIEQCGWKGFTNNNFGVHKNQALVLVNYGGATGKQIFDLSEQIILSVKNKFGITLEREVNII